MKKKKANKTKGLKKSKTPDFLEKLKKNNSMIEYITSLRIMNPPALLQSKADEPRREGAYVRLAHAREEFKAPVLTKGKSVSSKKS